MSSMDVTNQTKETLRLMFLENKRFDGRKVFDVRDFEISYNDGEGATDFAFAKPANSKEYSLMQMDGKIQPDLMKEVLDLVDKSCEKIYHAQKEALKEAVSLK